MKTANAYVLAGIRSLLATGEPTVTAKDAWAVCESAGCYHGTNHTKRMKLVGNVLSGSKAKGWTVTGPGLKHAASMIKATPSETQ